MEISFPLPLLSPLFVAGSSEVFQQGLTHLFPMRSFFYPLKTSENLMVFGCLQGVEKGCIGGKCVNPIT